MKKPLASDFRIGAMGFSAWAKPVGAQKVDSARRFGDVCAHLGGQPIRMIQADRDAFAANAARIQADSNLLNARHQLRLASGREESR